jgi:predicted amidohydrolase
MLRVALAQYPLDRPKDFSAWTAKLGLWIARAADRGARLLVFPEYGSMELAGLAGPPATRALRLAAVARHQAAFLAFFAAQAQRHGLHILAPSLPVRQDDGTYRNTAFLVAPTGVCGAQEKIVMTRFEREEWGVAAGRGVLLFHTDLGRIGVAICYDIEFPNLARRQAEAYAQLILVPSCTDSEAGAQRIRIGAQARALENQCYVVTAPTLGPAAWLPEMDVNTGRAGAFAPPDGDFPPDGVLAMGEAGQADWTLVDLDFARLDRVRRDGAVRGFAHWPEQADLEPARVVSLASARTVAHE